MDFTNLDINEVIKAAGITMTVVLAVWEVIKKLFDLFLAAYKRKYKADKSQTQLTHLVEDNVHQNETLSILAKAIMVQMRHSIVRIAEESLKEGKIGAYELQSLEELFSTYCGDLNGNSYVHCLMEKVRELPIDYSNGNPCKGELKHED